ncbi:unnamed protein product [Arabis nemorensis]|uniref:Uncharacterized protein n=1 Tax=Arabis nemorensis TaxID=586526 RepID=A0A565BAT7_9BRAS|nr:unnamed protein product [Arabis nemorensis]
MNAKKFGVLLLIGVVCANVGARQLEGVSKETKIGISIPKTVTSNALGAELSVDVGTYASALGYGDANAAAGPSGPSTGSSGRGSGYTSGYVSVDDPPGSSGSVARSYSGANGNGGANAAAGPNDATSNGSASGGARTISD